MYDYNYLGLNSDYTWNEYLAPSIIPSVTNIEGSITVITTISGGGGGQVSGPNIAISGGLTGLTFVGQGQTITLQGTLDVDNGGTGATTATGARSNLGAAKSGVNDDITSFTNLSGVSGFGAWTGASTKTGQATYSATADALYNQAQVQALMDKVQQLTEFVKALVDAHHGSGILET
jgi:hypothetical protein